MRESQDSSEMAAALASFTWWSILYNVIFVLNLASTSFMAYLNEPRPGQTTDQHLPPWTSFDDYVRTTSSFLQRVYSNPPSQSLFQRDLATNTFAMHRDLTVPSSIPMHKTFEHIVQMPFAIYYGDGMQTYLKTFLLANETGRNDMLPWEMCQHTRFLGATTSELCLWIERLGVSRYAFWASNLTYESIESIWIKFAFRCCVCLYICYLLWAQYYHHYVVLLNNLRHLGLSNEFPYYKIVLGDPAYVILSDPLVAFAMAADNWYSANYVAMAVAQVSQLHDAWLYIRGCFYLSRFVWFAYVGMQAGSFWIKRRGREDSFAPVDPALLAVSTYIYCGLIMSLICNTPLVWLMYGSWYVFLPPSLYDEAIETIALVIFVTLLMAILPLGFSRFVVLWQRRQTNRVRPTSSRMLTRSTSDYKYNDLKAFVLLSFSMRKHHVQMLGGTLHELYQANPQYRKLPLSSHRAADSFVLCYRRDGSLDQTVRLSLLSCLDPQLTKPDVALPMCTSPHSSCVCYLGSDNCETFKPLTKGDRCIHRGASNCQWIL